MNCNWISVRFRAVMDEHLCHLCPHFIGSIVTNMDILGEEELTNTERTVFIRENVDCFDCCCAILNPCNVDLNRQEACGVPSRRGYVQREYSPRENRWELCIQIQSIWNGVILTVIDTQLNTCGQFIIFIGNTIVVMIPVTRKVTIVARVTVVSFF